MHHQLAETNRDLILNRKLVSWRPSHERMWLICCQSLWIPDEAKHNMLQQLGHLWNMLTHHSQLLLKGGRQNLVLIEYASQRNIINDIYSDNPDKPNGTFLGWRLDKLLPILLLTIILWRMTCTKTMAKCMEHIFDNEDRQFVYLHTFEVVSIRHHWKYWFGMK